ncbi:hypothetical protein BIU88_08710 [Chlorobaculum limnaeum]|uniref:Uncharacterized protein n=1 Tax=Chlorobaculum limnaeum TaxID=274537 RepID=A0A1D8D233_CHLLM|nr:hypothetical protein BIU88_08710 [Chlorobaculum limnaeum]
MLGIIRSHLCQSLQQSGVPSGSVMQVAVQSAASAYTSTHLTQRQLNFEVRLPTSLPSNWMVRAAILRLRVRREIRRAIFYFFASTTTTRSTPTYRSTQLIVFNPSEPTMVLGSLIAYVLRPLGKQNSITFTISMSRGFRFYRRCLALL